MDDKKPMNDKNPEVKKKEKLQLRTIFYHNTFVLIFSFVCAMVIWFSMAASSYSEDKPKQIYDVPITIELSDAAKEEGIRVFYQSYTTADVSITGNNLILNKVGLEDISVVARLSPNSTKLTGNTMATETIKLTAQKIRNNLADYEVSSVSPTELNVSYDKYKETTFKIEPNIQATAATNFYVSVPTYSAENVIVSGPESSVNKVSRVAIDYSIADPISATTNFTCALTVYDINNKPINLRDSYLTLSVESVDVSIPVMNKQTVNLVATKLNVPTGFSDSRIVVEPATIDIAGEADVVSKYQTITLPTAIDFSAINLKNNTFEMEIPMPTGVKNVSNITTAKVTVNLSGFTETTIDAATFEPVNIPEGKTATIITKTLPVNLIGSQAQISRLTPASIYGTVDMAKLADQNGNVEVPVTINISGATSCWVYGQYTVQVNVQDAVRASASTQPTALPAGGQP